MDATTAPRKLSDDLEAIVAALNERPVTVREMIAVTEGRVYTLLLLLLALPFCTPLPPPGVSTVFGAVILLLGLRMTLGQRPWLPQALMDRTLPPRFFPLVLRAARRMVRLLESVQRPRMSYLFGRRFTRTLCGVAVAVNGLLLLLPLPIPLTNLLPALAVVLLAASFTERDGALLLAGFGMSLATMLFFGLLFFGGAALLTWLENHLGLGSTSN